MKITGTVVDKTPNLKIEDVKNALVQELKNRLADVHINYKGEIEWSAHKLMTLIRSFFDSKSSRIFGTKGIIHFNMNVHRGWTISFEISAFVRVIFAMIITAFSTYWIVFAGIPPSMKIFIVCSILVGFVIEYIILKFWFTGLIKKQIKKVTEAAENAGKDGDEQKD